MDFLNLLFSLLKLSRKVLLTSPFRWKQAIISQVMVLELRIASKQFLFWHVAIFDQCSQVLLYYVYSKHLMSVRNKETITASCKVRCLDPNCSRTLRFYGMINIKHKLNLNFVIVLFEINIFMKLFVETKNNNQNECLNVLSGFMIYSLRKKI